MREYWLCEQRGTNSDFLHESGLWREAFWHAALVFSELPCPRQLLLLSRSLLVAC